MTARPMARLLRACRRQTNCWQTRGWQACGWLGVIAIAVLSLVPGTARPHVLAVSQLEHLAAYAATAAALALGHPGRRNLIVIALLLAVYAAALEVAQLWVPGRSARLIDAAAGALGAWIGVSLVVLLRRARSAVSG
jgi:VanZ family protein